MARLWNTQLFASINGINGIIPSETEGPWGKVCTAALASYRTPGLCQGVPSHLSQGHLSAGALLYGLFPALVQVGQ